MSERDAYWKACGNAVVELARGPPGLLLCWINKSVAVGDVPAQAAWAV